MFSAESLSDCTELDIINDDILEDEENFHILLTSDDSRVLLNPQQGFVMIVDDDRK